HDIAFTIKKLPPKAEMRMHTGYIAKINESTSKIGEVKCHLATTDTLVITTLNGYYQAIHFDVAQTIINDSNLCVHHGNSRKRIRTRKVMLADTRFYLLPASAGYVIDSFTFALLPRRGDILTSRFKGSELKGELWEGISKRLKSGDRIYLNSFRISKAGG